MKQRFLTAAVLLPLAIVLMVVGDMVMAVAATGIVCFAVHEEFRALQVAGHRPVSWPTWTGLALSIPLTILFSANIVFPMLMAICLVTWLCVIFRYEPKLEDALMSVLPLWTIVLPGICVVALTRIQPKVLQSDILLLLLAVPVLGDTMAFFVGKTMKGPKLCPAVSPNKTISGAIGGLVGSLAGSLLVGGIMYLAAGDARTILPSLPVYLAIGLVGGIAGQAGDLFASLIKRHCGIKDFSNLFPGHGGMMDRIDSITFMAMALFCFRVLELV